jgi:eukaryotic-like serine/threonine-protein kinase
VTDEGRTVAGRYRLVQRIGSGAMGVVWQAHDDRLHRTVAVKQLLLEPGLSAGEAEEAKQRAMREGRIAARLHHPNAIAVYDVAEEDGQPWLVMEYLPSKSLSAVMAERGTLPPHEVARIGSQMAAALAAAHSAGIVHRDIKPGNVLLGDDGTVKITDFGISRATGDVTVTATGMLAGTPAYLAPEVAKGYDPGPPSDVFSLGATLYAAVEGEPPFGVNENALAMLHAVAAGQINPIRQAGPLTPLLTRLLQVEPTARPNMTQGQEGLAAVAAGRSLPPGMLAVGTATQPVHHNWRPQQAPAERPMTGPTTGPMTGPTRVPPGPNPTRLDARPLGDPTGAARTGTRGSMGTPPPHARPTAAAFQTGPPTRKKSRRPMMVTGLAIVAAAVAGILLASMFSANTKNQSDNQALHPPQAPAPVTSSKAKTPTRRTTTTTTTTTAPSADQVTVQQMERAVREYYSLLPHHPEQAWQRLSPRFQAATHGFDTYKAFWSQIDDVKLGRATNVQGQTISFLMTFKTKDGRTGRELHTFSFAPQNGQLLIDQEARAAAPPGADAGDDGGNTFTTGGGGDPADGDTPSSEAPGAPDGGAPGDPNGG